MTKAYILFKEKLTERSLMITKYDTKNEYNNHKEMILCTVNQLWRV